MTMLKYPFDYQVIIKVFTVNIVEMGLTMK